MNIVNQYELLFGIILIIFVALSMTGMVVAMVKISDELKRIADSLDLDKEDKHDAQ